MTPLGGFVPLFLMQLGELAPGGVGTGLYTILISQSSACHCRAHDRPHPRSISQEDRGEGDEARVHLHSHDPFVVLIGTAVAVTAAAGKAGVANPGPHGFSELLYAFSSAANNNGSAFGGLSANTVFFNVRPASRCGSAGSGPIVAALAIAGALAAKKRVRSPRNDAHARSLFVVLLIGSILLIGC